MREFRFEQKPASLMTQCQWFAEMKHSLSKISISPRNLMTPHSHLPFSIGAIKRAGDPFQAALWFEEVGGPNNRVRGVGEQKRLRSAWGKLCSSLRPIFLSERRRRVSGEHHLVGWHRGALGERSHGEKALDAVRYAPARSSFCSARRSQRKKCLRGAPANYRPRDPRRAFIGGPLLRKFIAWRANIGMSIRCRCGGTFAWLCMAASELLDLAREEYIWTLNCALSANQNKVRYVRQWKVPGNSHDAQFGARKFSPITLKML